MNNHQMSGLPSGAGAAERSGGERSETECSGAAAAAGAVPPANPEVGPRAKRRNFSASNKQQVLAASDAVSGTLGLGALLRREGLYSSDLTPRRHERSAGTTQGLTPRPPTPNLQPIRRPKRLTGSAAVPLGGCSPIARAQNGPSGFLPRPAAKRRPAGPTHHPRRSRFIEDLQACGVLAQRPGHHKNSQPLPHLQV